MKYFLLRYTFVADYLDRRDPLRESHIKLILEAKDAGKLLMAGAYADPIDGATILFLVEDKAYVEAFVQVDSFYTGGLITAYDIREWNVVFK